MKRLFVFMLALLQLWVPSALQWEGTVAAAAGHVVTEAQAIANATDGQSAGAAALTQHLGIIQGTQMVNQDANDTTTTDFNRSSGQYQFNVKEFGIGSDMGAATQMLSNTYNNPSMINDVAKQATRNLNESGCRATTFAFQRNITTLTVTPYVRTLVNGGVAQDVVDTAFANQVKVAYPTIGKAKNFEMVLRAPQQGAPGSVLKYQLTPFTVPNDGSYFTINHQITGSAGAPVIANYGSKKDAYTPQTMVVGNGGSIRVAADLYKVDHVFTAKPAGIACPADPAGCIVSGVSFCNAPALGVWDVFTLGQTHKASARGLLMDSVSVPDYGTNNPDMLIISNRGTQTLNGTDPIFTEVFTGCSSTAKIISTSIPVHKTNIQTCSMPRVNMTKTCSGTRGLHFVHLQSQAVKQMEFWQVLTLPIIDPVTHLQAKDVLGNLLWTTTDKPTPYSGSVDLGVATFGGGTSGTTQLGSGFYVNWSTTPAALSTSDYFSYGPSATSDGGISASFSSYGSSTDSWALTGSASVSGAKVLTVYTNIYQLLNNTTGCDDYLKLAADNICQQKLTCTDPRGPCTTLDGVSFCNGSGPAAGIAKLLLPWGVADSSSAGGTYGTGQKGGGSLEFLDRMCWAATGAAMDCSAAFSGSQQCYTDIGGVQHCNTVSGPTLATNFGEGPDFADDCAGTANPLFSTPGCVLVSNNTCAQGAQGLFSGECYNKTVVYDCGTTTQVTVPGGASYTQSCGGPIRCMGTECHNPAGETNTDFAKAIASTSIVSMSSKDLLCAETGTAPTSASQACTPIVFGGRQTTCKVPIGNQIGLTPNCCKESDKAAASGPDAVQYVKLLWYTYEISTSKAMLSSLAKVPGLDGFSSAFYRGGGAVKGSIDGAITSTKSFLTDSANTALKSFDLDTLTLPSPTNLAKDFATDTLGPSVNAGLSQAQMQGMYDMLDHMGMSDLANDLMSFGIDASGNLQITSTPLLDQAAVAMDALQTAFMVYSVAKIIGHLIFQCEQSELELGTLKKQSMCHYVGNFCAKKAFGLGCIESRESYCCYKSPLARMVAEQIRTKAPQIAGDYGSAKSPSCGGFTPAELGSFDWSLFDPNEWVSLLQDAGIIPDSASSADTQYAANVQRSVFTTGSATTTPDLAATAKARYSSLVDTYSTRRSALASEPICINSPNEMPWYRETVTPDDIVRPVGGTGSSVSCGVGCIELSLGRVCNNCLPNNNCSPMVTQDFSVQVDNPQYITKAEFIGAAWDDHIQMLINNHVIYQSPQWNTGPCELGQSWCIGSVPGYGCSRNPSNDPGMPFDITSYFKQGGLITTQTNVKVGGFGEGYAVLRIYWTPPPANSTDCTPANVTTQ